MKKMVLWMLFLCLLSGCAQTAAEVPLRNLPVSVVEDGPEGVTNRYFTPEDLNGNYGGSLSYTFLQEVTVHSGGKSFPVEEAIREGAITAEALVALAQADARAGFCRESSITENGLTQFTYTYPDAFQMQVINDVLEAPDGQQHRIQKLAFLSSSASSDGLGTFLKEGGGGSDYLDKEDWGLTLTVTEVSPTGLTLQCDQSGGQQFGQLSLWSWMLYSAETDWIYEPPRDSVCHPITMEGSTTLAIDWPEELSTLAPGSYGIRLRIQDIYAPEDVPPLSRNYYDKQGYDLAFELTIDN